MAGAWAAVQAGSPATTMAGQTIKSWRSKQMPKPTQGLVYTCIGQREKPVADIWGPSALAFNIGFQHWHLALTFNVTLTFNIDIQHRLSALTFNSDMQH